MADRVALVTGASRGIGRAAAIALAGRGYAIGINYSKSADEAKETLSLVEETGSEGMCVQADVGDANAVDALFGEVENSLGQVTALVNNAGVRADGLALSMKDDAWERVLRVNLYGTFACCRRALRPMLRARSGRIVNIASVAGLHGSPGQANYSAAKAGVIGLTKTLAREIASKGITVNAIAPGLVETDLTTALSDKQWDALVAEVPAGRAGTTDEVGRLIGYLCSEDADFITGGVFVIDGGMTA